MIKFHSTALPNIVSTPCTAMTVLIRLNQVISIQVKLIIVSSQSLRMRSTAGPAH